MEVKSMKFEVYVLKFKQRSKWTQWHNYFFWAPLQQLSLGSLRSCGIPPGEGGQEAIPREICNIYVAKNKLIVKFCLKFFLPSY